MNDKHRLGTLKTNKNLEKHFKDYLPPADEDTVLFLAGTTPQVIRLK